MNRQTFELSGVRMHTRHLATLLLFFFAALPLAQAKDKKLHSSAVVKVVAHMTFDNQDGLWVVYDKQPTSEDDNWQLSLYGG